MQYLVGILIVSVFLLVWIVVERLSQRQGLRNPDEPRVTCTGCQCGGEHGDCQIQGQEKNVGPKKSG